MLLRAARKAKVSPRGPAMISALRYAASGQLESGRRTLRLDAPVARADLKPPIALVVPVISEQFRRMLRAALTIAARHVAGRTIAVTAPAVPLGMRWIYRKYLSHTVRRSVQFQ